jgi:hypothetical protein
MKIEPCPPHGVNEWVMSTARKCQIGGIPQHEAESIIRSNAGGSRRPLKASEIERAISKAYGQPFEASADYKPKPKPKWQPEQTRRTRYRAKTKDIDECEIWESSPIRCDNGLTQGMILRELFPDPQGLVCVGKSAFEFHTARLDRFRDLTKCQFIVPCYMTAKTGLTQEGKVSMHCLNNCGPRRFCVCDFDEPASVDHPAIIAGLAKAYDLIMVLSSGGKSLHAWFCVLPEDEADFWEAAIPMGADPALMRNRSSFVRIPLGTRDNGRVQYPVYFDPSKITEWKAQP